MQERSIAHGTAKREPSGPAACGESGDSSRAGRKLWSGNRRGSSPSGDLDLRGFEDPDKSLVHLVSGVPKILLSY